MVTTHKFGLSSNTNKIFQSNYQFPKDIRVGEMSVNVSNTNVEPIEIKVEVNECRVLEPIVEINMVSIPSVMDKQQDDNRCDPIVTRVETEEVIKLEIKEIETVTENDKTIVDAEIHHIYEDKQSVIKNIKSFIC